MPIDFEQHFDSNTHEEWLETSLSGKPLLSIPQLNKGSAFTAEERDAFGLVGKLPPSIESLEQQTVRTYGQFKGYSSDFQQHIFLNNLHDTNHILFYKLVLDHIEEMMPLIYTPHVGTAVKTFSEQYRRSRGLYISYPDRNNIREILKNRSNPNIDLIVVTDGECVLGIGDQGVGAINIPIAKLMVYTLCGGINPLNTLPIMLDVGTNNQEHLNDPLYLGWRNPRLRGKEYDDFMEQFIDTVKELFPQVFLHFEDFCSGPARRNLAFCEDKLCAFNDDIQGTGAVAVATVLAAISSIGTPLNEQRIVIFGAGTAGIGIADQFYQAMRYHGLSEAEAYSRFWLIDRPGLLTDDMPILAPAQRNYARPAIECQDYVRNGNGAIDPSDKTYRINR